MLRNQDWEFVKTSGEQLKLLQAKKPKICSSHVFTKKEFGIFPILYPRDRSINDKTCYDYFINSENSELGFFAKKCGE